jgi:SAM-dependent methyltransferase
MGGRMTNPRLASNRGRAEAFGATAAEYDRVRPSYPKALIDDLVASAPRHALDVGCGTGKAARLLAARGIDVLGVEVDERMAEVARAHGVPVEVSSFESWDRQGRKFDLVTSGQAWHWVDPVGGAAAAAGALRSGGQLAVFWNFNQFDARTGTAFDAAYEGSAVPAESVTRRDGSQTVDDHARALAASGRFGPVERRSYQWRHRYPRADWLALIATHSDHLTLPAAQLGPLLERVGHAIDELGGEVEALYRTELLLARPISRTDLGTADATG